MNSLVRIARAAVSLLVLLGVSMVSGQQQVASPRVVLASGQIRYVSNGGKAAGQVAAQLPLPARKPSVAASSMAALDRYAGYFGIVNPQTELRTLRTTSRGASGDIVRYQQLHQGIPVLGGELVLTLDGAGQLSSLSGETGQGLKLGTVEPAITALQAGQIALSAIGKYHPSERSSLTLSTPQLWVYDAKLVGPDTGAPVRLVWRIQVTGSATSRVRELVLVDASNGSVPLHFNQTPDVLDLATYSANGTNILPGALLCDEGQPACTNGGNVDADLAHRYARDTYNFYQNHHGRDSFDNLGSRLNSTVQYYSPTDCPNAFWTGVRMVYCAGAPAADDVVGHELTHAVTEYASGLFYYYQSGAINESLSDIWGEFIDQTNGSGNDSAGVRWQVGEDWSGIGTIRDMASPARFGQPDRMGSTLYYSGGEDNGGVHRNSGVGNKAASLLVDGGTFNDHTIVGLGIQKVAALYYRVQTQHLTSGSDYADLYTGLNQACLDMVGGPEGIAAADCKQVANATSAVEMNLAPVVDRGTEARVCPPGQGPDDVFYDGAESLSNVGSWSLARLTGSLGNWGRIFDYAPQGKYAYYTAGVDGVGSYAWTLSRLVIVPPNGFLHFRHSFDQEVYRGAYADGGLVEYSIDGGSTWMDASTLYLAGKNYTGTISITGLGNPAEGRPAFVGPSRGFVSTRYDLASLTGQALRIRFRNTADSSFSTGVSWLIDDLRIYTCTPSAPAVDNAPPVAVAGADRRYAVGSLVTLDGSTSADPDGFISFVEWRQIGGTQVALNGEGSHVTFVAPATPTEESLLFRLTVTDSRGAVSTDDVEITTFNLQPVVSVDPTQFSRPRGVVTLSGSAMDSDGLIQTYRWSQISGPSVALGRSFDSVWGGASSSHIAISAGPVTTGTSVLMLYFSPALSNAGGTVNLLPNSRRMICAAGSTPASCVAPGNVSAITGSLSAPATADTSQAKTWTLNGVQLADGTPLTGSFVYNASTFAIPNIQIVAPDSTSQATTFFAPSVVDSSALAFRLTATDNLGGTGTGDVMITVKNNPPTAFGGPDKHARPRQLVELAGEASDSEDGVPLMTWTQLSGSPVTLTPGTNGKVTFPAPPVASQDTLMFRLTAVDQDRATALDEVSVAITNSPPSVSAGPGLAANAGADVTLNAIAVDADGGAISFRWEQVEGPTVSLSSTTSASLRFRAPSSNSASTLTFRVTATDLDGAQAADEVVVRVGAKPSGGGGAMDYLALGFLMLLAWTRLASSTALPRPPKRFGNCRFSACVALAVSLLAGCSGKKENSGGPPLQQPDVLLEASETSVVIGGSVTVNWASSNASACQASGGWSGTKATSGSQVITNIAQMTTFSLSCSGEGGSASDSLTVAVSNPAPSVMLVASATAVGVAGDVTLRWQADEATSCVASGGWTGAVPVSGLRTIGPLVRDTEFGLQCSGPGGSDSKSVLIAMISEVPPANPLAVLAPSVKVLDPPTMLALSAIRDGRLFFDAEVPIQVNEVFLANGAAYRAVAVERTVGRTMVAVTAPSLRQVLSRLDIGGVGESHAAVRSSAFVPGMGFKAGRSNAIQQKLDVTGEASLPWTIGRFGLQLSGTAAVRIRAEGEYHFDDVTGFAGTALRIDALATNEVSGTFQGAAEVLSWDKTSVPLKTLEFPISVTVVDALLSKVVGKSIASIQVPIDIGVEATIPVGLQLQTGWTGSYSAGVEFKFNADGSPDVRLTPGLGENSNTFRHLTPGQGAPGNPVTATAGVSLLAGLRVRPSFKLLSTVEAFAVEMKAGYDVSASIQAYQSQEAVTFCGSYTGRPQTQLQFIYPKFLIDDLGFDTEKWPDQPISFTTDALSSSGNIGQPCTPRPTVEVWFNTPPTVYTPTEAHVKVNPPAGTSLSTALPSGLASVTFAGQTCETFIDNAGFGSCTFTPTVAGNHILKYQYKGDQNFAESLEVERIQLIEKAPTAVTLLASPNPMETYSRLTFDIVVSASGEVKPGQLLPRGDIAVEDGAGNAICKSELSAGGTAKCVTEPRAPKTTNFRATYLGDATYAASAGEYVPVVAPSVQRFRFNYRGNPFNSFLYCNPVGACAGGPINISAVLEVAPDFTGTVDASGGTAALELTGSVVGHGPIPVIDTDASLSYRQAIFVFDRGKIVGWKLSINWDSGFKWVDIAHQPFETVLTDSFGGVIGRFSSTDLFCQCLYLNSPDFGFRWNNAPGTWGDGVLVPP